MKIILASASERRIELLKRVVEDFSVIVSNFDEESVEFKGDFGSYVNELSKGKAFAAAYQADEEAYIIACDTIVACDGKVLGKPKDRDDAIEMLKMLSGKSHEVYSGVTVLCCGSGDFESDFVRTEVRFSKLSEEEISKYVDTGEPMDKAGAYGIQGYGGVFVEGICGCYYSVVGLPINRLKYILRDMGVNL
ncbi:MAG: Maf-like protein [Bacillota bacterium]|nr:Maf-like protein [Bacillota bacterium]